MDSFLPARGKRKSKLGEFRQHHQEPMEAKETSNTIQMKTAPQNLFKLNLHHEFAITQKVGKYVQAEPKQNDSLLK